MKYTKFTVNKIIHFFTKTDKLQSFIYDVQQEKGGHKYLGNFTNDYG